MGADGGRPTSRGLPPAAFFWGTGRRGNGRCSSKGAALRGCGQGPQTDGPEGQTVPRPALYPRQIQTGYAPLKRFCPAHTCSPLARGRGGGVFPSLHSPTALRPKRLNISFDSKPCPGRARKKRAGTRGPRMGNIPFAETAFLPRPPTPQADGPCSWAVRRLHALPPHPDRNAADPPPARGAGLRQLRAEGAGRRHRRPEGAGRRHCRQSVGRWWKRPAKTSVLMMLMKACSSTWRTSLSTRRISEEETTE